MGQDVQEKAGSSIKPIGKQAVTITLYVSAEDLFNLPGDPGDMNQGRLDAYCILADNNRLLKGGRSQKGHVPPNGTLNDFISQVYANHDVTWEAKNIANDGYKVEITGIDDKGGFFKSDRWRHHANGSLTGQVKETIPSQEDTYTLKFKITFGNQEKKGYPLDPKLGNGDN